MPLRPGVDGARCQLVLLALVVRSESPDVSFIVGQRDERPVLIDDEPRGRREHFVRQIPHPLQLFLVALLTVRPSLLAAAHPAHAAAAEPAATAVASAVT